MRQRSLKREDNKKKGPKWTTCTVFPRQETTKFRPKYIKAMSLSNSTPCQQISAMMTKKGVFATTAHNSSIAVFCFTTTRERHQTTKWSSLLWDQELRFIFPAGDFKYHSSVLGALKVSRVIIPQFISVCVILWPRTKQELEGTFIQFESG